MISLFNKHRMLVACAMGIILFSTQGFSQDCPKIEFTYDDAGNRIQRSLIIEECGGGSRSVATPSFAIKVYPNPAMDKVNIGLEADTTSKESMVQLFDLTGKQVYYSLSSSLQMQVDVAHLKAGTYLLKITRGKKQATYNIKKA